MQETALITTPEALEDLVSLLRRQKVIALDTEADSFFHYMDKLCLIQISHREGIHLLDPLALPAGALGALEPVLSDPRIRKVFHAADYDLYILQRYGGLQVRNLFDTMISAQLLGYRAVGLAALVEQHFGVQLSKDQQRTDWSRRPLRPAQLEYAAGDVRYLAELAERLEAELKEKKRLAWAKAEFASLEEKVWAERDFDPDGYMRIKGARQLPPKNRAVLRELYLLRDRRARERDRPPFKIMGNGILLDLAQRPPRTKKALGGRKGLTDLVVRRLGSDIMDAVNRGLESPEQPIPDPRPSGNGRRRLDRRAEELLEGLKTWRARRARELDLDPGVFCPNAVLEEIAWARPMRTEELRELAHLKGWWVDEFGEETLAYVRQIDESSARPEAPRAAGSRPERRRRHGPRRKTPA
jgi:ribonuclease D